MRRTLRAILAAASLLAIAAGPVYAQAFVPSQGEGAVSVMYSDQFFRYHFSPTTPTDNGQIYARSMLFDVTYGLTDKVAVSVGLPLIATRYAGSAPHPLPDLSGPNPLDDGTWHATAQDFRFDLRYNVTRNLWNKGIVVTPFIGSIMPSHDYEYFIHSGFGKKLREFQVGASVAKLFERGIPGLIVQGRYGYGFTEEAVNIPHNRSLAAIEAGYFVTPKLRAMGLTSVQRTHGGIDWYGARSRALLTPEQFRHHDQITRENFVAVGGGASYSITETIDVYGSILHDVSRRNGHGLTRGVNIGMSYSFTTPHARRSAVGTTAEDSLAKCLCEKGTK